jgi:hypothetical protein
LHNETTASYRWLPRLILAMALLPLIIGSFMLWSVESRLITDAGQGLAMAATEIASKLDLLLRERMHDIQVLSQTPVLRTQNHAGIRHLLQALEAVTPEYAWVSLTDARGRVIVSTQEAQVGHDFSHYLGWRALQEGTDITVTDAVHSVEDDGWAASSRESVCRPWKTRLPRP